MQSRSKYDVPHGRRDLQKDEFQRLSHCFGKPILIFCDLSPLISSRPSRKVTHSLMLICKAISIVNLLLVSSCLENANAPNYTIVGPRLQKRILNAWVMQVFPWIAVFRNVLVAARWDTWLANVLKMRLWLNVLKSSVQTANNQVIVFETALMREPSVNRVLLENARFVEAQNILQKSVTSARL